MCICYLRPAPAELPGAAGLVLRPRLPRQPVERQLDGQLYEAVRTEAE